MPAPERPIVGRVVEQVVHWGRTDYLDALDRQHALVAARLENQIPDTLILTEHDAVVTLGRGAHASNVLDPRYPIYEVERGGDVTFHGPGQLMGYWIRLLPEGRRDLRAHLRAIETLLLEVLDAFGCAGRRIAGKTGVWVGEGPARKIASLGIAARNWCTYHGFALNVSNDLEQFRVVNPCGFDAGVMTSLSRELGDHVDIRKVIETTERLVLR